MDLLLPKDPVIKPLETLYKNVSFRSRTEARWAVFFDKMSIEWVYEYEGFDLGKYGWYLPDFYLPNFGYKGMFAEVKGRQFSITETKKCFKLCEITNLPVLLLDGIPDAKCYWYFEKYKDNIEHYYGLIKADQAEEENRIFVMPGYENKDLTISEEYYDCAGETFIGAVEFAKSYRF
jgi:hypothetical protein